jgi:Pvc16 N-terminal domain
MAWSTPDLSDITQVVLGLMQTAIDSSTLAVGNIKLTAQSPETVRDLTDSFCHLTLYLLHIGRDPHWRNTPVNGPRPQLNNAQPLSLNLSYLLSAWHKDDFTSEQRAMSIALQAIHSTPIVTKAVIQQGLLSQWLPDGEFTISIEADTIEEMSRLWQAFTVPIRLSALIRVGVVFLAPAGPIAAPMLAPTVANLSVLPQAATSAIRPILIAGTGQDFPPVPDDADPAQVTATNGPLTVVGGSTLAIAGSGLTPALAPDVFLAVPGTATEWQVTAWRQSSSQPDRLDLAPPAAYADPASATPPPTAAPLPGLYQLTVGAAAPASRSNAIPIAIAPRVDNVAIPPVLVPDPNTFIYAIAGAGFAPTATTVAIGPAPLTKSAMPTPNAGEFTVDAAGTAISFKLPSPPPPSGSYPVLIQVNGIMAHPGWIVSVP